MHLTRHLLTGAVGLCLLVLVAPALLLDDADRPRGPEAAAPTEEYPQDRTPLATAPSGGPSTDAGTASPARSRPAPAADPPPPAGRPSTPPTRSTPEPVAESSRMAVAEPVPADEHPDEESAGAAVLRGTESVVRGTSVLERGQSWFAGQVVLAFQGDGNLVLYDRANHPLWAAGTVGRGARTVFQADGNLVVYTRDMRTVWSSRTDGHEGAVLVLGADGNLVVRQGGTRLWATGTTVRHP
ncbi:hypothetical protein [Streptomyces sp. NPDC001770]